MRKRPGLANLLAALGLVAGLLCSAVSLAATDEERAAARAMAEKGAAAFQKKDYETSIDLFSRAEALIHSPVHLLFLARSHRALGQLVKAREAYIKIARERLEPSAPKVFFDAQEDASSELEAIEPKLASLTIQLEGAEANQVDLRVDGETVPAVLVGVPMPVDPGDHEVTAEAAGVDGQSQSVALKEGQQNEVRFVFDLPKPPARQPKPGTAAQSAQPGVDQSPSRALSYVGWTNVGLGAVGLGIGGYLWSDGSTQQADADRAAAACGKNCPEDQQAPIFDKDQQAADTKTTAAVVGAISGGVLLTGVVLLIVDSASSTSNTALHPVVGLNQLGVAGVF